MDNKNLKDIREYYSMQDYKTAMCIYRLQKEAGLSFKEARSLMINRGEGGLAILEEYALHGDALRMLIHRAERKLRATGKTLDEFCGEDLPNYMIYD